MNIPKACVGICLVTLIFNPPTARADAIRLHDGTVLEGEITKETETEVTIGSTTVLRRAIDEIEYLDGPLQVEGGRFGRQARVTLKSGEVVRGKIDRSTHDQVSLIMPIGRHALHRSSITVIEYEPVFPGAVDDLSPETGMGTVEGQLGLLRLEGRQGSDRFALGSIWLVTLFGDLLGDGTLHSGAIFPVVGPFLAADSVGPKGSKAFYIFSGFAQALCTLDLINTSVRISRLERRVYLSLQPEQGGIALSCKF